MIFGGGESHRIDFVIISLSSFGGYCYGKISLLHILNKNYTKKKIVVEEKKFVVSPLVYLEIQAAYVPVIFIIITTVYNFLFSSFFKPFQLTSSITNPPFLLFPVGQTDVEQNVFIYVRESPIKHPPKKNK